MSIEDLEKMETNFFDVKTIASFMNISQQGLRTQAKQHPETLGFPCCLIGTRLRFPKTAFLTWYKGNLFITEKE